MMDDDIEMPELWSQQQAPGSLGSAMDEATRAVEQRQWYLKNCLDTLVRAQRLRRDADLMVELRAFIRKGRDELAAVLDDMGEP